MNYQCLCAIILLVITYYILSSRIFPNTIIIEVVAQSEKGMKTTSEITGTNTDWSRDQGISNFSSSVDDDKYIYISRLKTSSMTNKVFAVGSFSVLPPKSVRDSRTEIPSSTPKETVYLQHPLSATTPSLHSYRSPLAFNTTHTHKYI